MMKTLIKTVSFPLFLFFVLLLNSCKDPENATLYLSITPSKEVNIGDNITLDASASIYDSISWELDKKLYGPCMTLGACTLSFNAPGNHTMRIEIRKDAVPDWTGTSRKEESKDGTQITLVISDNTTSSKQKIGDVFE